MALVALGGGNNMTDMWQLIAFYTNGHNVFYDSSEMNPFYSSRAAVLPEVVVVVEEQFRSHWQLLSNISFLVRRKARPADE